MGYRDRTGGIDSVSMCVSVEMSIKLEKNSKGQTVELDSLNRTCKQWEPGGR